MAKQRQARPLTRQLVRWSPVMDQRLLLAIQYSCNQAGVKIPFNQAGSLVGPSVTEGAIVQHLAKLRGRLVGQGESVPPMLKRGGGPTGIVPSNSRVTKNKRKAKPQKRAKGGDSDDSEEEDSNESDDYSGYKEEAPQAMKKGKGKMVPKVQAKSNKPKSIKSVAVPIKKETSDDGSPKLSAVAQGKRARLVSDDDDDYEQAPRPRRVAAGKSYALITRQGHGSQDYSDEEDEDRQEDWVDQNEGEDNDDFGAQKTVAAGAPFLQQESDSEDDIPGNYERYRRCRSEEASEDPQIHGGIAKLPIGRDSQAAKYLQNLAYKKEEASQGEEEQFQSPAAKPSYATKSVAKGSSNPRPTRNEASYGNEYGVTGYGSNQYTARPVSGAHHQDFAGYGSTSTGPAQGFGRHYGDEFGNTSTNYRGEIAGSTGMGSSPYDTLGRGRDAGYNGENFHNNGSGYAGYQPFPDQQYQGYPVDNDPFGGVQHFDVSPPSSSVRQPQIKYEQSYAGPSTGNVYGQHFSVPQLSNAPTPRESFNSLASTNMPPTPSGEGYNALDAFVQGNTGYLDQQADLQGGKDRFDAGLAHFEDAFNGAEIDFGTEDDGFGFHGGRLA